MKLTLRALLARGYFPPELPPPFTTNSFAVAVARANDDLLPEPFTKRQSDWCDLTVYSLSRPGSLRRRLGIVNPIAYFRLARFIVTHQTTLLRKASSSKLSLGKVIVDATGLNRSSRLDDVPRQRAMVRIGEHLMLRISADFIRQSIRTPSIGRSHQRLAQSANSRQNAANGVSAPQSIGWCKHVRADKLVASQSALQPRCY